jgi:hypothetical protein
MFVDMNPHRLLGLGSSRIEKLQTKARIARVLATTALWHRLCSGIASSGPRDVLHRVPAHACHVRRHHHPASHHRGGARPAPGRNVVLREPSRR